MTVPVEVHATVEFIRLMSMGPLQVEGAEVIDGAGGNASRVVFRIVIAEGLERTTTDTKVSGSARGDIERANRRAYARGGISVVEAEIDIVTTRDRERAAIVDLDRSGGSARHTTQRIAPLVANVVGVAVGVVALVHDELAATVDIDRAICVARRGVVVAEHARRRYWYCW